MKLLTSILALTLLTACTTIHVYSEGDVVVDAHKQIVTDTAAGI